MIMVMVMIIISIRFLSRVNCHRNRAYQELGPRDSCIFNTLTLGLESLHRHKRSHRESACLHPGVCGGIP